MEHMKNAIRFFKKELEKSIEKKISDDEKKKLEGELKKVVSIISHVASKGVIHKNEARRRISRIMKYFNKVVNRISLTAKS